MLFQTEKLSSFHCCKLWILLYFIVNIESITAFGKFPDWGTGCDPIVPINANGRVDCTDENYYGSRCSFTCYGFISFPPSTCSYGFETGGLKMMWNPSPPECIIGKKELRCEPPIPAPINGRVRCTKSNSIGSECYFGCKPGYELTSQSSLLCSYDFSRSITKWSPPSPPVCIYHGTPSKDECYEDSRIDMVFVLDGSGSISSDSFEHVKTWTKKVGEHMIDVFGSHVHIGIVQFASKPQIQEKLQIFRNTAEFDVVVDGITQLGGGTNTVDAMNKALEVLSVYRPKCPGDYQKIMVLLTDGFSSQSSGLLNEARILQDAGVISFAVGVKNANYAELKIIAYGHEDRIFEIGHFDFLQLHENAHDVQVGIAKTLKITCDPPRTAPENGNVSCTHANELGSECTYTCDAGYTISNSSLLTTYCKIQTTGVGGWSEEPPTCTSIRATYKDEFNYFDSSKWYVEVTGRPDNNELEYYTNRSENYRVENGHLIISPLKENYEGRSYTSARMHSKFSWKYGRVEVRAKLPNGFGLWPAIWMMPKYSVYGGWPQSGEIDIMEARGQNLHQLQSTIHYGKHFSESSGDMKLQCSIDEYHVYTLDWTPTELVYRLDGKAYYRQDLDRVISYMYSEKGQPFDQEFYLILNVAVGGNYLENPKPSTKWNYPDAEMWVDYVRVYSLEDIASQGRNGSWTLNDGGVQEAASECVIKNGTSAGDICGALQWACYSQHYTDVSAQCNAASTQLNCCNSNPYSCNYNDLVEGAGKVFQAYYSQIPSDTSCDFGGVCQLEPLQCTNGYGG